MSGMTVRSIKPEDRAEWLRMRLTLWPHCSRERHEREMSAILGDREQAAAFVSLRDEGGLCGFIEMSIRPSAEGCQTRPVGYIEGWYVDADRRRRGVGKTLVATAEEWARSKGCKEIASDANLDNEIGKQAHRRPGYTECNRLVHFRKDL